MTTPSAEELTRLRALGTAQVAASRAIPRHPHLLPALVAHDLLAPREALRHLLALPRAHGSMRGTILAALVPFLDPATCLEAARAIRGREGGWGHWGSAALATAVLEAGGAPLITAVLDDALTGAWFNAPFAALPRLPDGAARAAALIEALAATAHATDDADEVIDALQELITAAPAQVPPAATRALLDGLAARLTGALPYFDADTKDPRLGLARASLALAPVGDDPAADLARALALVELVEGAPYPFGAPPPPPGASPETVALRRAILDQLGDGERALRDRATASVPGAPIDVTWIPFLDAPAIDALLERDLAALATDPWHAPTRLTIARAQMPGDAHRARRRRIAEAIAARGWPTEAPGVWEAHPGFAPLTVVAGDLAADTARALLADLLRWGARAEAARDAPLPAHDGQAGAFLGATLALADAADDGAALTPLFDRRPAYLIEVIREPATRARWMRLCAAADRARWLRAIPARYPPAIDPAEALTTLVALAAPASAAGRGRARPLTARLLAAIDDGGTRLTLLRRLAAVALIDGDHARELEARLATAPPLEVAWAIDDLAAAMPHLPPAIAPVIARRLLAHAPGSRFTSGDTHYQTRAVAALVAALGDNAAAAWQDLGLPTATAAITIVPAPLRDAEIARRGAAAPADLAAHAAWASHGSRPMRDAAFARLVAAAEADPAIDPATLYPFADTADEPELLRVAALLRTRASIHVSAWLARAMTIGATEAIASLGPLRFRTSFEGEAPNAWTLAAHATWHAPDASALPTIVAALEGGGGNVTSPSIFLDAIGARGFEAALAALRPRAPAPGSPAWVANLTETDPLATTRAIAHALDATAVDAFLDGAVAALAT